MKLITGLNYQRLKFLLTRNMVLYTCHLPLDAHPRLGNNAQICKALGLQGLKCLACNTGSYRVLEKLAFQLIGFTEMTKPKWPTPERVAEFWLNKDAWQKVAGLQCLGRIVSAMYA